MDSHNVGRNRKTIDHALKQIQAKTLIVGISKDVLFPLEEQVFLAEKINNSRFFNLDSFYGHDGFLIDTEILTQEIGSFLKSVDSQNEVVNLHIIA
jgi:homoserine O-acetyltransferase